ncbi:MAG TPA: hypothetical protein VMZ28_15170 [Kofleriaceae bacterium]|nr:hypothetical protein [Kofleriaceae bacterium]
MDTLKRLLQQALGDADFKQLDDAQSLAVLDLLNAVVLADGELSEAEANAVSRELLGVPWSFELPRKEVEEHVERSRKRISKLRGAKSMRSFVEKTAAKLPDGALREKIARMMVLVAAPEGINDAEESALQAFAEVSGIPPQRLKALKDAAGV